MWEWLGGFVVLRLEGENQERVLNLAMQRGIEVWDSRWVADELLELKAARTDLRELKKIAKICGCGVQVGLGRGLPFVVKYLRGRKGFAAGLLLFVLGLVAAGQVVWQVNVLPQEELRVLDAARVAELADELGVRRGAIWGRLDTEQIAGALADTIPEISWVYIERSGTVANIKVAERSIYPEELEKATLGAIVANRDGLVQDVLVKRGQAKAAPGDTVLAGDVLVEPLADGRADAIVHARVWYSGYGEVALREELPVAVVDEAVSWRLLRPDGQELLLWGRRVAADDGQRVEATQEQWQMGADGVACVLLREDELLRETELRELSVEEARAAAYQAALAVIYAQQNRGSSLLREQVEYSDVGGEVVSCEVTWECLENIGHNRNSSTSDRGITGNTFRGDSVGERPEGVAVTVPPESFTEKPSMHNLPIDS